MAEANKKSGMVVMDPETGELMEVSLDEAAGPSDADLRSAVKLEDIDGPVAIFGVKILDGKTFDKQYAEFIFARNRTVGPEIGVTASANMVETFRNIMQRGLASNVKPLLCKFKTDTKTSSGYYVHKMEKLSSDEEASLRAALKA